MLCFHSYYIMFPHQIGINVMIDSIIRALPELTNVLIVLTTVCFMFAVAGVILFGGPYLHTRCRLTPFPGILTLAITIDITSHTYPFTHPDRASTYTKKKNVLDLHDNYKRN